MHSITNSHTNFDFYIEDFKSLNESLKEKYGEPTIDDEIWYNDIMDNDPGNSLAFGYLEFVTYLETENTQIQHKLSGDNLGIRHDIFYFDPNREYKTDTTGL